MKRHFDLISIGLLAFLGPLFVFPREKWNWALLAAVSLIFLGRWLIDRRLLSKTPIDTAIVLLLLMAFAGVFVIKDIRESAGKLAGLAYGILVFYMLIEALKTPIRMKIAVFVFLLAGLGMAVVGTLGRIAYPKAFVIPIVSKLHNIPHFNLGLKGAEAGVNMNPLGGALLLFIPLGVLQFSILLRKNRAFSPQWIRYIGLMGVVAMLGVQALAVLISTSLNTWFALSIALWLMVRWRKSIKIGIILLGISAIILLVLRTGGISPNGSHGFESAINISIKNRIDIWKNGFEIAKTHPVLGIGMDQLRRTPKMLYEYSHAHNQFLHTAAELGIPGLVAYLAILFGIYRMTKEVKRSILPEWIRMTSRGLGTGVFAFTLFGMVDTIPLGAKIGIFFWISIAMITCIYLYGRSTGLSATSGGRGNG